MHLKDLFSVAPRGVENVSASNSCCGYVVYVPFPCPASFGSVAVAYPHGYVLFSRLELVLLEQYVHLWMLRFVNFGYRHTAWLTSRAFCVQNDFCLAFFYFQ